MEHTEPFLVPSGFVVMDEDGESIGIDVVENRVIIGNFRDEDEFVGFSLDEAPAVLEALAALLGRELKDES